MNYKRVFKQSWDMVWRYRALWLLGAILALTTANGFFFIFDPEWDTEGEVTAIKISENSTIYLPGDGTTIDLTDPNTRFFQFDDSDLEELRRLFREELSAEIVPEEVWAVLIALGVIAALTAVVGVIARYTAEAGLIRMVNEREETGQKAGILRGLRLGFSRSAWRLFVIDIVVNLPLMLALFLAFVLALLPLLLWRVSSTAGVTGVLLTFGGVLLVIFLSIIVSAALSLFVQIIRRACAVEELGVLASIGRGLRMVRGNFKEVLVIWLVWIGTRLAWMIASIPVLILISPILLLFVLAGVAVGAVPAVIVGELLTTTLAEPAAWIIGVLAGLPLFLLVTLAPMLFLGGLVEIFKSATWTLAYRELLALECTAAEEAPAPGAALGAASAN